MSAGEAAARKFLVGSLTSRGPIRTWSCATPSNASRWCYGRPRITAELRRRGWVVNPKKVYRILREDNYLRPEIPRDLPIAEVAVETIALNFESARNLGINFPTSVVEKADSFVNLRAKSGRPARIALVHRSDSGDETSEHLLRALGEIGLERSLDFTLAEYKSVSSLAPPEAVLAAIASFSPDVIVGAGGDGARELEQNFPTATVLVATALDAGRGEEIPKEIHQTALRITRALASPG